MLVRTHLTLRWNGSFQQRNITVFVSSVHTPSLTCLTILEEASLIWCSSLNPIKGFILGFFLSSISRGLRMEGAVWCTDCKALWWWIVILGYMNKSALIWLELIQVQILFWILFGQCLTKSSFWFKFKRTSISVVSSLDSLLYQDERMKSGNWDLQVRSSSYILDLNIA